MTKPLTFAVPKGRILDEALPVMARTGITHAQVTAVSSTPQPHGLYLPNGWFTRLAMPCPAARAVRS